MQRGLRMEQLNFKYPTMKLWVVGRLNLDRGITDYPFVWEIMGVFSDEKLAVESCTTKVDFVGPVDMNVKLPDEVVQWPGLYYPLNPLATE